MLYNSASHTENGYRIELHGIGLSQRITTLAETKSFAEILVNKGGRWAVIFKVPLLVARDRSVPEMINLG
jgi:hypothetical protein